MNYDYLAKRRPRLPKRTGELEEAVGCWISERVAALSEIRENGRRAPEGLLERLATRPVERWAVGGVGDSRVAWMERDVTSAALLMDFRVRRFGRRLKDGSRWEHDRTEEALESSESIGLDLHLSERQR